MFPGSHESLSSSGTGSRMEQLTFTDEQVKFMICDWGST